MWKVKYLTPDGIQWHSYKNLDEVQLRGKIQGVEKSSGWQHISHFKEF